jgi:hypothetical protein
VSLAEATPSLAITVVDSTAQRRCPYARSSIEAS